MELKEGELLTIGEVIRWGLANNCEIAIYGSENEETASNDTEGEKSLESITSMNGGKVKYRVKSFDDAKKILSVIREVTWA